jgi:putative restriction endonuclease
MQRANWLEAVRGIQSWESGGQRVPHKPLLLLYALGRLQRTGSPAVSFGEAERDLSNLLREYSRSERLHPEYPFFHLKTDGLWQLSPSFDLPAGRSPSTKSLRTCGAVGELEPGSADALRQSPGLFSAIVRFLLDHNFPSSLHDDICAAVGLDLTTLEVAETARPDRARNPAFRAAVLLTYEYRSAVCGYEGHLGGQAVGLEAAHVRWWAGGGPDAVDNGLCLCSLHHKLLDSGVLGMDEEHRLLVSMQFIGRSEAAQALVLSLAGKPLLSPQAGQPPVALSYIAWHRDQVFKAPARAY